MQILEEISGHIKTLNIVNKRKLKKVFEEKSKSKKKKKDFSDERTRKRNWD